MSRRMTRIIPGIAVWSYVVRGVSPPLVARFWLALVLAVATVLPLAAGAWRGVLELDAAEPHVCVCPIGADGNCECRECIRLGIHEPVGEHEHDREVAQLAMTSQCETPPDEIAPPSIDRAVVPALVFLPAHAFARSPAAQVVALTPDGPILDPDVPPPRPA